MLQDLYSLMRGEGDFLSLVIHICVILMIVFLVLPFHEWAHAWVASLLGDTNIKYRGRLSLNPMSHIDYMGALCLLLFGFGWAKPVPVDPSRFKNPKWGMALVSLAGPLANIVAGIVGGLIYYGLYCFAPQIIENKVGIYVMMFLSYYVSINCGLAAFNLIPIPPLDGSKIVFAFLPDKWVYKIYEKQQIISIVFIALIFLGVLDVVIATMQFPIGSFVNLVSSLPYKLIFGM